ncbi:MAG: hypothetical protein ACR2RE_05915 [Geminicoccaceae bacterium]
MHWLWITAAFFLGIIGLDYLDKRRKAWRGRKLHAIPLRFINARMGVRPTILGHTVPDGYRLACLYFGAGLIDRTDMLDHGFAYDVLDPIPELGSFDVNLAELNDRRARAIIERAERDGASLALAWSGGIDSTGACAALLKALTGREAELRIVHSKQSVVEYPRFYDEFIKGKLPRTNINSIQDAYARRRMLVTGEHGDQLFGSAKAMELSFDDLKATWEDVFPSILRQKLALPERADALIRYLEPQIKKAPFRLENLFDLLWWINFSMKWQAVSQRIPASIGDVDDFQGAMARTEHFFRTDDFQRWSMTNPDQRIRFGNWASYKWPLKDYIKAFTGDNDYRYSRVKQPSLRGLENKSYKSKALAIGADGRLWVEPANTALRKKGRGDGSGFYVEHEIDLWDLIDGDGE